jgi:ATP-dependent exoDNAse (exonuclease V) beta subunit
MQALIMDFGLSDFYRDQSRLSDDLDQANEEDLLEVIVALSENFQTIPDFYQFVCKSIDNEEPEPQASHDDDRNGKDEVYLGTIHRAKGKEFQNVVYFNLSKTGAASEKLLEEERRVAYVGATRPKDSLLITFSSAKPSKFLAEIALNPKFDGLEAEELERKSDSVKLRLKRENVKLQQIELQKKKLVVQFEYLTEALLVEKSAWLLHLNWLFANWRIQKTQEKIEVLNQRIRKQIEAVIRPLEIELGDLEEEIKLRNTIKPSAVEEDIQK